MKFYRSLKLAAGFLALLVSASPINAKDLFVSPSGDDGVSYADNSISNPWRSIAYAIYNVRAGDTLNIRGGTYYPTSRLLIASDYDNRTYGGYTSISMNAEGGTASEKVVIQGYEGEEAIIDLSRSSSPTFIEVDDKDYWEFRNFKVINGGAIFVVGKNGPANHIVFDGLELVSTTGGDNSGTIKINSDYADFITINNNIIKGPGTAPSIHQNTSGVYARILNNIAITNNLISDAPIGIYYKHRTVKDEDPTDIQISNNLITNTSRAAAQLETVGAIISNNIITPDNAPFKLNEAAGSPGGDRNSIIHNTFGVQLELRWDTQAGDPTPGAIDNIVRNNLFLEPVPIHWYSDEPHGTRLDHNLYAGSHAVGENRLTYMLNEWQDHSGQDANSLAGDAVLTGSLNENPDNYRLVDFSTGYKAASSGANIGANVDLVGPSQLGTVLAKPEPPTLSIE